MLPLDNLSLRDLQDSGVFKQKKMFALFNQEQRWGNIQGSTVYNCVASFKREKLTSQNSKY